MPFLQLSPLNSDWMQGIEPKFMKGLVYDEDQKVMISDFKRLLHAS